MLRSRRLTALLVVVPPALIALSIWLLAVLHPFRAAGSATSQGTEIAAALAAAGVGVTAAVTLVGLFLRSALDDRVEARELAMTRRMELEAATQTVGRLSKADGEPADVVQSSAALIALSHLGPAALAIAVALADELWPAERVSTTAAVYVADMALSTSDVALQRTAALLLYRNRQRLPVDENEYEWPASLSVWPTAIDEDVRVLLVRVLVDLKGDRVLSERDLRAQLLAAAAQDPSGAVRGALNGNGNGNDES